MGQTRSHSTLNPQTYAAPTIGSPRGLNLGQISTNATDSITTSHGTV